MKKEELMIIKNMVDDEQTSQHMSVNDLLNRINFKLK